ncbi:hypothetical protein OLK001_24480 [Synechocystis sp. LKSZ1]
MLVRPTRALASRFGFWMTRLSIKVFISSYIIDGFVRVKTKPLDYLNPRFDVAFVPN